jgi:hypothetical protein
VLVALAAAPTRLPEELVQLPDPEPFDPCKPPAATGPAFLLPYRRPVETAEVEVVAGSDDPIESGPRRLRLACVRLRPPILLRLGVSLRYEQQWNVLGVHLGDLSSTLSLAPGEKLTLEFQTSQRRVLEQNTVDSAEEMTSLESTTADKEVINAARSSTKTEGWHIDGNASISLGKIATLGIAGGGQGSVQSVAQSSVQHIAEATRKSAHSLKTLHKIEVRGVSETFVQNRMTRTIQNPYPDRTLSINVFQLVRRFGVETRFAEVRRLMTVSFDGLDFDADFVIANADFLRQTLLDTALIDELPAALAGAKPQPAAVRRSTEAALLALDLLFDEPDIFHVTEIEVTEVTEDTPIPHVAEVNPNPPRTSFDQKRFGEHSGLEEGIRNNLGVIFTTINFFFATYQRMKANRTLPDHALSLALALANGVKAAWDKIGTAEEAVTQGNLRSVLAPDDFSEVFRRLSGFLALVAGTISASDGADAVAQRLDNEYALKRLLDHLACNRHFYTQQYLAYLTSTTNNQAIVDLVEDVINRAKMTEEQRVGLRTLFDTHRAFIDRQQVHVESIIGLRLPPPRTGASASFAMFDPGKIDPIVDPELELPTDGVHLEVAQGRCELPNVPDTQRTEVDMSIKDAHFHLDASG